MGRVGWGVGEGKWEGEGSMPKRRKGRERIWEVECGRERENSNSKTLFYKDCSLGSLKNLSNN